MGATVTDVLLLGNPVASLAAAFMAAFFFDRWLI
jgi:hypothetical protein